MNQRNQRPAKMLWVLQELQEEGKQISSWCLKSSRKLLLFKCFYIISFFSLNSLAKSFFFKHSQMVNTCIFQLLVRSCVGGLYKHLVAEVSSEFIFTTGRWKRLSCQVRITTASATARFLCCLAVKYRTSLVTNVAVALVDKSNTARDTQCLWLISRPFSKP